MPISNMPQETEQLKTPIIVVPLVTVELTNDDAMLFREFQKRYEVIGQLVGYMDSLKVFDLKNMTVTMDLDNNGKVCHTAITRHYRS